MGPGTEKAIVRFPRSLLSKDQEFNRVSMLRAANGRVTANVAESINEEGPCVVYELDSKLNPMLAAFCDTTAGGYQDLLVRNPKLESAPVYARRLLGMIQIQKFGW